MQKGKTLRFIVMFLSGFLATASSVYAFHFAGAGVQSDITPKTTVQFWFLGVSSEKLDPNSEGLEPVIPTQFQCTVVHNGKGILFRLFASAQGNPSFAVEDKGNPSEGEHLITITGKLLSRIVFVLERGVRASTEINDSERGVRAFTEINDFTVTGVDRSLEPGEGNDSFVLKFTYSAQSIQSVLLDAFGANSGLVDCPDDRTTCTLTLQGIVKFGDMVSHTSSGD